MMVKTTMAALACALFTVGVMAGCGANSYDNSRGDAWQTRSNESSIAESDEGIGADRAREIALEHAGYAEDEVVLVHEGTQTVYGQPAYELEFYSGKDEHDYTIDAATGDIVAFDEDAERYVIADWWRETPPSTDADAYIGEDIAKAVALENAGLAEADITDMRVVLDFDDRVPRYEVEFSTEEKAYEYDIHAIDGKVMSFEAEQLLGSAA